MAGRGRTWLAAGTRRFAFHWKALLCTRASGAKSAQIEVPLEGFSRQNTPQPRSAQICLPVEPVSARPRADAGSAALVACVLPAPGCLHCAQNGFFRCRAGLKPATDSHPKQKGAPGLRSARRAVGEPGAPGAQVELAVTATCYSLSPAVIWVAESSPSEAAAASGHTQPVKAGWS